MFLNNSILSNRQSLCFVIIAPEKHHIRLLVNQYHFAEQRPDWQFFVFDGDESREQLLVSSNSMLVKHTVQTRQTPVVTIIIRRSSTEDEDPLSDVQNPDRPLLDLTWSTSLCPDNQFICGGHFENKCYTKEQRCDGSSETSVSYSSHSLFCIF